MPPEIRGFLTTVLVIFCVSIASLIVYFSVRHAKEQGRNKYLSFVRENSLAIKNLLELNRTFVPHPPENFDQSNKYDNETHYFNISCEDYLIYQLQFLQRKVKDEIKICSANQNFYVRYLEKVNALKNFGNFATSCEKLKIEKLIDLEKQAFQNLVKQKPLPFSITIRLVSVNYYGKVQRFPKTQTFNTNEILALIKRINNKSGHFYNDREIWDAICRVERGKVSNKLRFAIYERDGFRCQICGKVFHQNVLEIDHIKPIAKGGKTTIDNLQTLCHDCNVKKGATYEE